MLELFPSASEKSDYELQDSGNNNGRELMEDAGSSRQNKTVRSHYRLRSRITVAMPKYVSTIDEPQL